MSSEYDFDLQGLLDNSGFVSDAFLPEINFTNDSLYNDLIGGYGLDFGGLGSTGLESLNFGNYLPMIDLGSNSVATVDLTGDNYDWNAWDKDAADYLASSAYKPSDTSLGDGIAMRPLWDNTGTETGIKYVPGVGVRVGSGEGAQPFYYASGERAGLTVPTEDMPGLKMYSGDGARDQLNDFDIMAMSPEGRAMLRDAGVSPEVLNYYESWANANPTETPYLGTISTTYTDKGSLSSNVAKAAEKLAEAMGRQNVTINVPSREKTPAERLAEVQAKVLERKIAQDQAREAAKKDPVKKTLNGLAMAAMLAQAMKGKSGSDARRSSGAVNVSGPKFSGSAPQKKAKGGVIKAELVADEASIPMLKGGLGSIMSSMLHEMVAKQGGRKGLIRGEAGGQDDVVDVKAAPGEYVFDAETVSALGDGNTNAGAKKLDEMRKSIRKHKRGGALSQIAPKAKSTKAYMES